GTTLVPVGSAFTYQGQLKLSGTGISGLVDLQFTLFDAAAGGSQIGATNTLNNVSLTNGLFTVTLDFGSSAFATDAPWMQIVARSPAGRGPFLTLSPRQSVSPTPFALRALSIGAVPDASLSGTYTNPLTFNNAANAFTGNGAGLTNLNASNIASGSLGSSFLS